MIKKWYKEIILAILGLVFVVSLISMMFINQSTQNANFWKNQKDKLSIITQKCVVEISEWCNLHTAILRSFSSEIASERFSDGEGIVDFLARIKQRNPEVVSTFFMYEDGEEYYSSDECQTIEFTEQFAYWCGECFENCGQIFFTEPYVDPLTDRLIVSCMQGLVVGERRAIVGTDIALTSLIEKIDSLRPSKSGGTWLVSAQLKVMTYLVDSSFLPKRLDQASTGEIDIDQQLPSGTKKYIIEDEVAFLNGAWVIEQVQILEYIEQYKESSGISMEYIVDYDGKKKYEATAIIESSGWILGVNIPISDYEEEVSALVRQQMPIIMLGIIMGTISIAVALFLVHDIRKASELSRRVEVARAASKTKSDFLSRMSHEMRTPMNAIIGMSKIAENTTDIQRLKYCLSNIEASSTHLLGIINDVLDMSKIEAGKLVLEMESMNLEKMLMKICNLIADKTEQKSIRLDVVLGKNMGMHYVGDELRLSQVIANLMSNAVKFTQEGGSIKLMVDEVSREDAISTLRFSVIDSGIGMSKAQLSLLFNAFEQTDSSISRRYGGTGLGLAICKSIVEKMGGRISVRSELGKGSTFEFEIKAQRESHRDTPILFDAIRPKDLKLLIVDDDQRVREQFIEITSGFGMGVEEADRGEKAVLLADQAMEAQRPYDIIFLDYDMPGMNGIETAQALGAKIDKNTVIIMAGFLTWGRIEKEAKNVGVTRFIAKPLFPSAILDAINDVVGRTMNSLSIKTTNTESQADFGGITLLLAEDIEINREIFVALLEPTKINIEVAENGAIAYQKFLDNHEKYDIIVMDIQMPEMDGYEATAKIRALDFDKARTIPIIAMTANVFREDVERCLACGMNDHLAKPINEAEVIASIERYVQKKSID